MRKVDHQKSEIKKDAILKAAAQCFTEKGIHSTSIQDISRASGVLSGGIYYYFPSKESIITSLFDKVAENISNQIVHMLDNGGDITGAILGLHANQEALRRDWNIAPVLRLEYLAETARNPQLREIYARRNDKLEAAIREAAVTAIEAGRLDPKLGVDNFTRSVMLLWMGISVARVHGDEDIPLYEAAIASLLEPWLMRNNDDANEGVPPARGDRRASRS